MKYYLDFADSLPAVDHVLGLLRISKADFKLAKTIPGAIVCRYTEDGEGNPEFKTVRLPSNEETIA